MPQSTRPEQHDGVSPEIYSAQLANFFLNCDRKYLLNTEDLSHVLRMSPATIRTKVCRAPKTLPVVTKLGSLVFFAVGDVIDHLTRSRVQHEVEATPRRRAGRPTEAERLARQAAQAGGAR